MFLRLATIVLSVLMFFCLSSGVAMAGPPPSPTSSTDPIVTTLRSARIYVAPEVTQYLSSSTIASIEQQLKQDDTPVFVAFLSLDPTLSLDAAKQLKQEVGTQGEYIVVSIYDAYVGVGNTSSLPDVSDSDLAGVIKKLGPNASPEEVVMALIKYTQEHHKKRWSAWVIFGIPVLTVILVAGIAWVYRLRKSRRR